jgi:cysteine desulfurase
MQRPAYFDNAATTPMDPRVFEAMRPWFMERYGNASSGTHLYGWEAGDAVDEAREQVASLIGARSKEVVFTSGATESVNLALKGVAEAHGFRGVHIVTCVTEHRAVLDACLHLERLGCLVDRVGVDRQGCLDLGELEAALRPETRLIALMYANNETGVMHPVRDIAGIARERNVLFLCDATQAVGKINLDAGEWGIDLLAFSAHKFHGPKGVGGLYIRKCPETSGLVSQMDGGGHERGLRSGTLNVPGIVGMGAAAALCNRSMDEDIPRIRSLRDRLETALMRIPGFRLNGHADRRLPNISNLGFDGIDGPAAIKALSGRLALSSGSACRSLVQEPSHVLTAMGLSEAAARSSFRFSLGRYTTPEEVGSAIHEMEGLTGSR